MLADESPVPVTRRKEVAGVEGQAERGCVVAERVVGDNRPGDEVGALRLDPLINVLAEVGVGPAVETAILDEVM